MNKEQNQFYFLPNYINDDLVDRLSKLTLKLILKLFRDFSSNPESEYQELSLTEIKEALGSDKPVSRNSIKMVINQIKENNIFIIKEDFKKKEKTFVFYLAKDKLKFIVLPSKI